MKNVTIRFGTGCLTFILGLGLVSLRATFKDHRTPIAQHSDVAGPAEDPSPCAQNTLNHSPIRDVDFENFTYPAWPIFGESRTTFTLRDGQLPVRRDRDGRPMEVGLSVSVTYYDVTGDGIEDAIVGFGEDNNGGSAIVYGAYIYTLRRGRPVFLWGFEAGDRADGGLRSIYGRNGELVIELEGKDKIIGKNLFGEDETANGACCPTLFTRTTYQWNGKRFLQNGDPEILPLAGAPDAEPFPARQLPPCDRNG